jgi:hypothetical protein
MIARDPPLNGENVLSSGPRIPSAREILNRLAVISTEAGLLRAQLRISRRYEEENKRLREMLAYYSTESNRGQ